MRPYCAVYYFGIVEMFIGIRDTPSKCRTVRNDEGVSLISALK